MLTYIYTSHRIIICHLSGVIYHRHYVTRFFFLSLLNSEYILCVCVYVGFGMVYYCALSVCINCIVYRHRRGCCSMNKTHAYTYVWCGCYQTDKMNISFCFTTHTIIFSLIMYILIYQCTRFNSEIFYNFSSSALAINKNTMRADEFLH